ncbi:MAG: hypothetical protein V7K97_09585 [Nostoc sp.]|uniref:hypothetical protein n=1 Tax=Nostoc sp. TaxID=1180 RepID=UPI002FF7C7D4
MSISPAYEAQSCHESDSMKNPYPRKRHIYAQFGISKTGYSVFSAPLRFKSNLLNRRGNRVANALGGFPDL